MNRSIAAALLATVALPGIARAQATPSDFTHATRYDAMRRVTGTIAPDPDGSGGLHYPAVRNTYDQDGRLVRVEKGELSTWQDETIAPVNWSGFTVLRRTDTDYDAMDRKVVDKAVDPSTGAAATLTHYGYDAVGRLQCTAVRMDPAAFGSLPASACTLGSEGSYGPDRVAKNVYDDAGQLLQVRRAVGTSIEQAYETYSYSPNGKQLSVTDANGNRAEMTYDGMDRQQRWIFPSPTTAGQANAADYEEYGYDADGNRTSLRKRDGRTFGFSYDALNRMTVKTVPAACVAGYTCTNAPSWATRSVFYAYDAWGRQTEARYDSASGGDGVFSGYDGFGRLTSTTTAMGGTSRQMTFGYDADGNRNSIVYPDGTYVTSDYDGLERIHAMYLTGSSLLLSYAYNASGERSGYGSINGTGTAWNYDGIGRLTSMNQDLLGTTNDNLYGFAFNPASQIAIRQQSNDAYAWTGAANTSKGYAVNGLNQYTSVAGAGYGYDANGNLTSDGTTNYVYDAENRLVSASNGTTLTYDPNGRLWQTAGGPSGTTRFLYDGDQLSAEYDGSGNLLRRYLHGTGEDDPLVWYEGSGLGSPRYYHTDHQGSIVALSDAGGNASAINSYDEYGVPARSNQGRFGYTGQAWLPDLGLYHYKARVYSPQLGRMLQTDPVGYKDQVNLYAYVANDPVNRADPSGEESGSVGYNSAMMLAEARAEDHDPERARFERQALGVAATIGSLFVAPESLLLRGAVSALRMTRVAQVAASASRAVALERFAIARAGVTALEKGGGKVIMGAGTKVELRQGERLAAKYGGESGSYAKITTGATRTSDGASVQVHAYKNIETGKIYEPKLKIQ